LAVVKLVEVSANALFEVYFHAVFIAVAYAHAALYGSFGPRVVLLPQVAHRHTVALAFLPVVAW
jgi:hypothetical protein